MTSKWKGPDLARAQRLARSKGLLLREKGEQAVLVCKAQFDTQTRPCCTSPGKALGFSAESQPCPQCAPRGPGHLFEGWSPRDPMRKLVWCSPWHLIRAQAPELPPSAWWPSLLSSSKVTEDAPVVSEADGNLGCEPPFPSVKVTGSQHLPGLEEMIAEIT